MRVLLLLGQAWPADQGALAPLAARLLAVVAGDGFTIDPSREIAPDLAGYDLVHLLPAPPVERAARQFLHARRWGCPVVVTAEPRPGPPPDDERVTPPQRYDAALRHLLVRGANATVTGEAAGATIRETYRSIMQERARMAGDDSTTAAGQWLPGLPPEEYGRHLEDLCQLQLEVIAYRDAEYEQLHRQIAGSGDGGDGQRALQAEYERLGEWSRDLAARHEALQAEHARLQEWAGALETRLRAAQGGGLRGRVARLVRRR